MDSRRLGWICGLVLLAGSRCTTPDGPSSTNAGATSSSATTDGTASGSTGTVATSTTSPPPTTDDAGSSASTADTDEPFVSACADGHVGGIDGGRLRRCVVLYPDMPAGHVHGLDLDSDGRDEIFVDGSSGNVFDWDGDSLTSNEPRGLGGPYSRCLLRYDLDDDGRKDIHCIGPGGAEFGLIALQNLGNDIGESLSVDALPKRFIPSGAGIPVDPEGDGSLEVMMTIAWPVGEHGFRMFRLQDGVFQPEGETFWLGGCAVPDNAAYADFDEDGAEDVVIVDSPVGCDPYPIAYDPSWHRVHVFRSNAAAGLMELSESVAIGAMPRHYWGPVWAEEVTGDTHTDIIVALQGAGLECYVDCFPLLMSVLPGRGDGRFEPALVYVPADAGLPGATNLAAVGQFDGDLFPELVVRDSPGETIWVLDDVASGLSVLETIPLHAGVQGVGDFDGDGVDDLALVYFGGHSETIVLLSNYP